MITLQEIIGRDNRNSAILEFLESFGTNNERRFKREARILLSDPGYLRLLSTPDIRFLRNCAEYLCMLQSRATLIINHACQLKCVFCTIRKESAYMTEEILSTIISCALHSPKNDILLHYYAVEPLLSFDLISKGTREFFQRAGQAGKHASVKLSTNGGEITEDKISFFREFEIQLELSLDGTSETCASNRRPSGKNPYDTVSRYAAELAALPKPPHIIMVCPPSNVEYLYRDFLHVINMGFTRIQINFAQGIFWNKNDMRKYLLALNSIGNHFRTNPDLYKTIDLVNLRAGGDNIIIYSNEPCIDFNGTVYASNLFLTKQHKATNLRLGSLLEDDLPLDFYTLQRRGRQEIGKILYGERILKSDNCMAGISRLFAKEFSRSANGTNR